MTRARRIQKRLSVMQALLNWNDDYWENAIYVQPTNIKYDHSTQNTLESKLAVLVAAVDFTESKSEKSEDKGISIDPIIEIVRLFNQAYLVYTTDFIPSGRKEEDPR